MGGEARACAESRTRYRAIAVLGLCTAALVLSFIAETPRGATRKPQAIEDAAETELPSLEIEAYFADGPFEAAQRAVARGETRAAVALLKKLLKERPDAPDLTLPPGDTDWIQFNFPAVGAGSWADLAASITCASWAGAGCSSSAPAVGLEAW